MNTFQYILYTISHKHANINEMSCDVPDNFP